MTAAVPGADVVLVAVPGPAVADVLTAVGSLDAKVIIDAANMMGTGRLLLRQLADAFPGAPWMPTRPPGSGGGPTGLSCTQITAMPNSGTRSPITQRRAGP